MEQQNNQEQTTFNMSLAILKRIDLLLSDIALASKQRDLHQWFDLLQTLKREVDYQYDSNEEKSIALFLQILIPLDNKYLQCKKLSAFNEYPKYYTLLEEYGKFIKRSLYLRGMLVVKKADPTKAVLNM
jgi:hypothetical protein